eukprot:jgi/Hompol1/2498/HPOL_006021-RA
MIVTLGQVIDAVRWPALVAFTTNAAMFAVSAPLQTERLFDVTGTSSFILCAAVALFNAAKAAVAPRSIDSISALLAALARLHPRQLIISGAVVLWAARLGSFLFYR